MLTSKINTDGTVDLTAKQGTTWELTHSCFSDNARTIPISLSGLLARGQIRKDYKLTSPIILEFTCEVLALDEITNPNENKIVIRATAAQSSSIVIPKAQANLLAVYDVEAYSDDEEEFVERVMEGTFSMSPEVTRPIPTP